MKRVSIPCQNGAESSFEAWKIFVKKSWSNGAEFGDERERESRKSEMRWERGAEKWRRVERES